MDYEDPIDTSGNPDSNDTGPNRLKWIEAKKTSTSTVLTKFSYGYRTPRSAGGTNADTSLRHSVTDKDNVTSKYCPCRCEDVGGLGPLRPAPSHQFLVMKNSR